jgi:hypothetical protein
MPSSSSTTSTECCGQGPNAGSDGSVSSGSAMRAGSAMQTGASSVIPRAREMLVSFVSF